MKSTVHKLVNRSKINASKLFIGRGQFSRPKNNFDQRLETMLEAKPYRIAPDL